MVLALLVAGLIAFSLGVAAEPSCDYAAGGLPDCYEPLERYGYDDRGDPNVPRANPRANACFGTGTFVESCVTERDWRVGWHLIRLQTGVLDCSQVPTELYAELAQWFDCSIKPSPVAVESSAVGSVVGGVYSACLVTPVVSVPSGVLQYYIASYYWSPQPSQSVLHTHHAGATIPVAVGVGYSNLTFPVAQPPYNSTAELVDGTGTVLLTFAPCPANPLTP
jgi:hypothetical protein